MHACILDISYITHAYMQLTTVALILIIDYTYMHMHAISTMNYYYYTAINIVFIIYIRTCTNIIHCTKLRGITDALLWDMDPTCIFSKCEKMIMYIYKNYITLQRFVKQD